MIISGSWLQAEYGKGSLKYLAEKLQERRYYRNFTESLRTTLIDTCIILLDLLYSCLVLKYLASSLTPVIL